MPAGEYPFIEIAVHSAVRDRFAAGQGLAVLSPGIDYVHWANGAAARQLGYNTIYAFLEDEGFAGGVLARQIAAAAGRLGPDRPAATLSLRLGTGFRRMATSCTIEAIRLPDGAPAVLLALPAEARLKDSLARAASMIEGFGDGETHVAVLDGEANSLAQSSTFDALAIHWQAIEDLVESVGREESRLVKRTLATAAGPLPAAIARLSDDPAVNLVFVVEPAVADTRNEPARDAERPAETGETATAASPPPALAATPAEGDRFAFDPAGRPVRFVWKIDAEGRFSEISPEFSDAVGPNAADVVGRTFDEVAKVFNLDPNGVIEELLRRRDTWSGRTVHWPVQGTALAVPVDLAALPTYRRDRSFDGFRGFGIVRVGEAGEDPERLGLALEPAGTVDSDRAEEAPQGAGLPAAGVPSQEDNRDAATRLPPSASNDDHAGSDTASAATAEDAEATGEAEAQPPRNEGDPFRGEVPALRIVEAPARQQSDKVIEFDRHHRGRGREGLSTVDQAIFRQIGEELGKRLADPAAPSGQDATQTPPRDEPAPQAAGVDAAPADDAPGASEKAETPQSAPAPTPAPEHVGPIELARPAVPSVAMPPPAEPVAAVRLVPVRIMPGPRAPLPAAEPVAAVALAHPDRPPARPSPPAEHVAATALTPAATIPDIPDEPEASYRLEETPDAGPGAPAVRRRPFLTPAFVDGLPLPILVHRGDILIHANRALLDLTGHDGLGALEEAGGYATLIAVEDPPLAGRPAHEAPEKARRATLRRADGTTLPVDARLQSVGWGDGHALMLALAPLPAPAHPSTPAAEPDGPLRAGGETELRELRSVLEIATDGVVILGEDATIRSMNRSASALFDYDEAETRGQPFAMLFAHESQRAVLDYLAGLSENGVASVLNDGREVIGREASGGFIPLFMTMGVLKESRGYCVVMRDITHWKRTEEELRSAKRAADTANAHKSEFLARVSHEIRTPLNAIIGFADMMTAERFGPLGSGRYLEYAHDIARSGKHVLDIVNDLLDISKIEAGEQVLDFVAVSLNETLAETVSLLQPQANAQRVIIRTSLSAALPDVVADERSVRQIAINLLANAIRFTPSGGQIVVSTAHDAAGRVVLRVRDTGIGMSRTELEQAMKPFRQGATSPMRPRGDGTGLGLPLTKAMVEANRAQFSIESAPGEGTLVQIAFPSQRVLTE